jgi:hypothetical protein
MMRRVFTLTAAALAVYLSASQASARNALAPVMQTPPVQVLPPDLVVLEQKMAHLQVTSERFTVLSRGTVKITDKVNGRPVGRTRYVSLNGGERGEISLSPNEAEITVSNHAGVSNAIFIGSTGYRYWPKLARFDGGRPWVRSNAHRPSTYPYEGSGEEVDAGGTGPYAHLINLLATAVGAVVEAGSVTVDGQKAYEFESSVNPLRLVRGLTQEDVERLEANPLADRLTVYITESGLPVRVVENEHNNPGTSMISSSTTTDILAVGVPVRVNAPAVNRTIGQALFNKIVKKHGRQLGIEDGGQEASGSA